MHGVDAERLHALLGELADYTLIVEGCKDERALKTMGLRNIIPISGRPLAELAGGLDERSQVVILTDFDPEGRRLAARLIRLLQSRRIKTNPRLRRMMMELGKTRIEDWAAHSAAALEFKEKGDFHGETGANFYKIRDKSKHKGERDC